MAPREPAYSSLLPLSSPHSRWLATMYEIHLHIPPTVVWTLESLTAYYYLTGKGGALLQPGLAGWAFFPLHDIVA